MRNTQFVFDNASSGAWLYNDFFDQVLRSETLCAIATEDWITTSQQQLLIWAEANKTYKFIELRDEKARQTCYIVPVGDTISLVTLYGSGKVDVYVAAPSFDRAEAGVRWCQRLAPKRQVEANERYIGVWQFNKNNGGTAEALGVSILDASALVNYAAATRAKLTTLLALRPPFNGRVLIWTGLSGTGKTSAVRMLIEAWRGWCGVECVIDPEELFKHPHYISAVMRGSSAIGDDEKWRLVVLEDAGELVRVDARSEYGPGLARFLNFSDGLIGQHGKCMFLITTNEDITRLHSAVARPGRCIDHCDFTPLSASEADGWRISYGLTPRGVSATLAELYAEKAGVTRMPVRSERPGF